jgi:hypothetical protein
MDLRGKGHLDQASGRFRSRRFRLWLISDPCIKARQILRRHAHHDAWHSAPCERSATPALFGDIRY